MDQETAEGRARPNGGKVSVNWRVTNNVTYIKFLKQLQCLSVRDELTSPGLSEDMATQVTGSQG